MPVEVTRSHILICQPWPIVERVRRTRGQVVREEEVGIKHLLRSQ